jgi:hypothetical protein
MKFLLVSWTALRAAFEASVWGRLRIRKKSYAKLLAGGVAVIFGDKWRENSALFDA